jgi:hypothetical protein
MIAPQHPGWTILRLLLCLVMGVFALNGIVLLLDSKATDTAFPSVSELSATNHPTGYITTSSLQTFVTLDALIRRVAAAGECSPFGEPINGQRYRGNNAFFLCSEKPLGPLNVWKNGRAELRIACRPSSLRNGWKWHIWCNEDGSSCGCNESDFNKGAPGQSCCQWSAGDHCTVNGSARPRENGCATW